MTLTNHYVYTVCNNPALEVILNKTVYEYKSLVENSHSHAAATTDALSEDKCYFHFNCINMKSHGIWSRLHTHPHTRSSHDFPARLSANISSRIVHGHRLHVLVFSPADFFLASISISGKRLFQCYFHFPLEYWFLSLLSPPHRTNLWRKEPGETTYRFVRRSAHYNSYTHTHTHSTLVAIIYEAHA